MQFSTYYNIININYVVAKDSTLYQFNYSVNNELLALDTAIGKIKPSSYHISLNKSLGVNFLFSVYDLAFKWVVL